MFGDVMPTSGNLESHVLRGTCVYDTDTAGGKRHALPAGLESQCESNSGSCEFFFA